MKNNKRMIIGAGLTGLSVARYCTRMGYAFDLCDTRESLGNLAEIQKQFPQAQVFLGALDANLLSQYQELIVSPGIALAEPAIAAARAQGVAISGDINEFAKHCTAPILAITGSNGKSTVTTLVGELLNAAGINTQIGGNIGLPALDLPKADIYVLELSSFQLETTENLKAKAAVILNLSEDHMDRYSGMDDYLAAKQRIFQGCEFNIYNRDDSCTLPHDYAALSFGLGAPKAGEFGLVKVNGESVIAFGDTQLVKASELKIKGSHNLANVMAALALVKAAGVALEKVLLALKNFAGLDFRCQWLGERAGVTFYNDSKGTNVGSTLAALAGLGSEIQGKIWLLAGGDGKGQDFSPLAQACRAYAAEVLCYGRDGAQIAQAVKDAVATSVQATLNDAFARALLLAKQGDVIVLSPACASFDQYRDYVHRGEVFTYMVQEALCH